MRLRLQEVKSVMMLKDQFMKNWSRLYTHEFVEIDMLLKREHLGTKVQKCLSALKVKSTDGKWKEAKWQSFQIAPVKPVLHHRWVCNGHLFLSGWGPERSSFEAGGGRQASLSGFSPIRTESPKNKQERWGTDSSLWSTYHTFIHTLFLS